MKTSTRPPKSATPAVEVPPTLRTPGLVLRESLMKPLGLSAYRVAKDAGMPQITLSQILRNRRAVTPSVAVRLGRYFGMNPQIWLILQAEFDLSKISADAPENMVQRCAALGDRQVVVSPAEAPKGDKGVARSRVAAVRFGPAEFTTIPGRAAVVGKTVLRPASPGGNGTTS